MDYVEEGDVVMFNVKLTLRCTWEKTDHLMFTSKKKSALKLDMKIRSEVMKNILRKI